MSIKTEWVRYGEGDQFSGYVAWPERATGAVPSVIVIQEAWGVNDHIEDVTRRIAGAGYVALSPDLFAKDGQRVPPFTRDRLAELLGFVNAAPPAIWMDAAAREAALAQHPAEVAARMGETMKTLFSQGIQPAQYVPKLMAASAFLRKDFALSRGQKVASAGFCMGGAASALLACHDPELAGAAIFYGSAPAPELVPNIRCPLIGFYGSLDTRLADAVPAFVEVMKEHGKQYEPHIYEGAHHAFFNDGRPSYHVGATRDSYVRLLQFLQRVLG